ncbi:MAG: ATP-binding cassette domain-containing protein, partial [Pseudomonadota bacterium]
MLEFTSVTVRQGSFTLTADWSLTPGVRAAIIGPSGAGKSTLLMGLAGFLDIEGHVSWQGQPIEHLAPAARPMAVLFQDNNLFAHMTVGQNAGLGLRPSLRLTNEERERVVQALADVGLKDMSDRKPSELSGGQQSRAALARVMLQDKPWLLLDEPFAALGPALKSEMLDLVAELCTRKGAGLMMVSHDPDDARRICDQSVLVADGAAHAPMETAHLLDNPPAALK